MYPSHVHEGSLKGQFLIAMPQMMDPNFALTVTYMCEHSQEGAFGLVINRPLPDGMAGHVFQELEMEVVKGIEDLPIYVGGPVHSGHLFILHGPPLLWEVSLEVSDGISMSNSRDILEAIAAGKGPSDFLLVLGCAGWAPGQLEEEILANSWLNCPGTWEVLFETPVDQRWDQAAKSIGVDLSMLTDTAGHA